MLKSRVVSLLSEYSIKPFTEADVLAVKDFTDRAIGTNYYSLTELEDALARSLKDGKSSSFILVDSQGEVRGLRLTFPPGQWHQGKGKGLSPHKWKFPLNYAAYFQSLFVDPSLTKQGWGTQLSLKSIEVLKSLGAKAVVCHSWKESPNDSSGRYVRAMGFELVAVHPMYWNEVDYECTRCGKPCVCTAEEMIKYI